MIGIGDAGPGAWMNGLCMIIYDSMDWIRCIMVMRAAQYRRPPLRCFAVIELQRFLILYAFFVDGERWWCTRMIDTKGFGMEREAMLSRST